MQMECDLAIIGSGVAGLTTALTASAGGLHVIVLEADALIGGATALSEGMIWAPNSNAARALPNAPSEREEASSALAYLEATAGTAFDTDRARAYITAAPQVLAFLEGASGLTFTLNRYSRDYYPDAPGATFGRRALNPDPFDAREMGRDLFARIRSPLGTMMIWGGMSIASRDLPDFLEAGRNLGAAFRVAKHFARHARDRLTGWPRGARLGNGNAIVARLAAAATRAGVDIRTDWPVERLQFLDGSVTGVFGIRGEVLARKGVVLASGGLNAHPTERRAYLGATPHLAIPASSPVAALAELVGGTGAVIETNVSQPVLWAPGSAVPPDAGRSGPWPHFGDRAKPGVICVGPDGRRFINEAVMYHDFVPAMVAATHRHPEGPHCWLLCDHDAIRRYGLGPVGPYPIRLRPYLDAGYLRRGFTLANLAGEIGVPIGQLEQTITRFNAFALKGSDPDFGRGNNNYDKVNGDPRHWPNPSLGPLSAAPFYAIRLIPADIGTFIGIRVDQHSRAISWDGEPIPGLWAAGNAATPLTSGSYPAAGLTIGAAAIFGWIAARNALAGGDL
jgi:glycine/D-amino acid oxidase-like deaminating enzyme